MRARLSASDADAGSEGKSSPFGARGAAAREVDDDEAGREIECGVVDAGRETGAERRPPPPRAGKADAPLEADEDEPPAADDQAVEPPVGTRFFA